jgi:hypothetical protein
LITDRLLQTRNSPFTIFKELCNIGIVIGERTSNNRTARPGRVCSDIDRRCKVLRDISASTCRSCRVHLDQRNPSAGLNFLGDLFGCGSSGASIFGTFTVLVARSFRELIGPGFGYTPEGLRSNSVIFDGAN